MLPCIGCWVDGSVGIGDGGVLGGLVEVDDFFTLMIWLML